MYEILSQIDYYIHVLRYRYIVVKPILFQNNKIFIKTEIYIRQYIIAVLFMFHQCVALSPSSNKPSLQLDSIAPVSFLLPTHKLKNEEKTANNMTYKQSRILNQFNIHKTKQYRINEKA